MNNLTKSKNGLLLGVQGIQWAVFMLINIIAVPVVIGAAFHMSPAEISTFMQRMLFVSGVATLIQAFIGHRLPVIDGPSGMWWAIFLLLGTMSAPGEEDMLLQQLEMGLMIGGLFLVILGFLPIIDKIRELFTPIVTDVYLILLVSQLSGSFLKSILGINATHQFNWKITAICLLEIVIILLFSLKTKGIWKSMGPLFGIVIGWYLIHLFGILNPGRTNGTTSWFSVPKIFTWGTPEFDLGIVLTSMITSIVLISNVIASILVVGSALEREIKPKRVKKGVFGNGINMIVSGMFSVVGVVPISGSAGFISTTGIKAKQPLIIGAAMIIIMGFFPYIGGFLSTFIFKKEKIPVSKEN